MDYAGGDEIYDIQTKLIQLSKEHNETEFKKTFVEYKENIVKNLGHGYDNLLTEIEENLALMHGNNCGSLNDLFAAVKRLDDAAKTLFLLLAEPDNSKH